VQTIEHMMCLCGCGMAQPQCLGGVGVLLPGFAGVVVGGITTGAGGVADADGAGVTGGLVTVWAVVVFWVFGKLGVVLTVATVAGAAVISMANKTIKRIFKPSKIPNILSLHYVRIIHARDFIQGYTRVCSAAISRLR
jgi:hypothetical protein